MSVMKSTLTCSINREEILRLKSVDNRLAWIYLEEAEDINVEMDDR